jgi:isocitrate lyase
MSTAQLPLKPLSADAETKAFEERVKELEEWWNMPRFTGIKRPYPAASVVTKQGSYKPVPLQSEPLADKLFRLLKEAEKEKRPLHTIGVIDPVQMSQIAENQEVVYLSGWACSSTLTAGSNEVGPDLACVQR